MAGSWDRYAAGTPQLIPGVLRGFRQFKVLFNNNCYLRSAGRKFWWNPGENVANCPLYDAENVEISNECNFCADSWRRHQVIDVDYWGTPIDGYFEQEGYCIHNPRENLTPMVLRATGRARHSTPPPGRECMCGFYGTYSASALLNAPGVWWERAFTSYPSVASVVAVVEAYGNVILAERGFRSEKMRVLGLSPPLSEHWISEETSRMLQHSQAAPLREKFNVFDSLDRLVDRFPVDSEAVKSLIRE